MQHTRMKYAIIISVLILLCTCGRNDSSLAWTTLGDTLVIYVSPCGCEGGDGSPLLPVATLENAEAVLARLNPVTDVEIRIIADRGSFYNQLVDWAFYVPNHTITFAPWPIDGLARFEMTVGKSSTEPFFRLRSSENDSTHLIFRRFYISGYNAGAIWFTGDRYHSGDGWNGGNLIDDCVFFNIGNKRVPGAQECYGVLDFVNSRGNTVRDSRIDSCSNREGLENPIIGIYLAHHSSANIIQENVFWVVNGDGIRIRDQSNLNIIDSNEFEKVGYWANVSMWYCSDPELDEPCDINECPSWGNVSSNNLFHGHTGCGLATAFNDLRPALKGGCAALPPGEVRITQTANVIDTCHYHPGGGIE